MLLLAALSVALQYTRFENRLAVTYEGNQVLLRVHGQEIRREVPPDQVVRVDGVFQQSMVATTGIHDVEIESAGTVEKLYAGPIFLFWGRDLLSKRLTGKAPSFKPSFGDWTMDRALTPPVELVKMEFSNKFSFLATVSGRGHCAIQFNGRTGKVFSIDLHDGFIDNSAYVCTATGCSGGTIDEPRVTNLLRILSFLIEMFGSGLVLAILFAIRPSRFDHAPDMSPLPKLHSAGLLLLLVLHFAAAAWFAVKILGAIPHIPDSALYVRQAILLSHGMLSSALPPVEPFEAFLSNSAKIIDGRVHFLHANDFWPGLLAIAIKCRLDAYFLPILSTLSVFFLFRLSRAWFDGVVAWCATLLFACAPFSIIMAGDFMQHAVTLTTLLAAAWFATLAVAKKHGWYFVLVGALLAYALGVRQLTMTAMVAPVLLFATLRSPRWVWSRRPIFMLLGALPLIVLLLVDNHRLSGNWLVPVHQQIHGLTVRPANLQMGMNYTEALLGYLPSILSGIRLPQIYLALAGAGGFAIAGALPALPLFLFLSMLAGYSLLNTNGLHGYGPRFVFEISWLFPLFVAFFLQALSKRGRLGKWLAVLALFGIISLNCYSMCRTLPSYRSYNQIYPDAYEKLAALDPARAIMLTKGGGWQPMDSGARLFQPDFTGLLFIHALEDGSHQKILDAFPERTVYRVDQSQIYPATRK